MKGICLQEFVFDGRNVLVWRGTVLFGSNSSYICETEGNRTAFSSGLRRQKKGLLFLLEGKDVEVVTALVNLFG